MTLGYPQGGVSAAIVAASALRQAAETWSPIAPLRDDFDATDEVMAYAIQDANTRHWLAEGRRLVGRKIGLTAKSVQRQLGVDKPDYGALFADTGFGDEEPLPRFIQPKVEVEVALVLGRDIDQGDVTFNEFVSAVDHALVAIEVVDSRVRDWDISYFDTVADNASSGGYVVSGRPARLADLDLHDCRMRLTRAGEVLAVGQGRACLGHPLNAAVWLARRMAVLGEPLKAGDLVLTGALGPMVAAAPGDVFRGEIEGLGAVHAVFGEAAA